MFFQVKFLVLSIEGIKKKKKKKDNFGLWKVKPMQRSVICKNLSDQYIGSVTYFES